VAPSVHPQSFLAEIRDAAFVLSHATLPSSRAPYGGYKPPCASAHGIAPALCDILKAAKAFAGKMASVAADVALERSLRDTAAGTAEAAHGCEIPTIDLAGDEAEVATAIWDAAKTVGFFSVINHGIDAALIDSCFDSSAAFFARDLDAKKAASPFAPQLNSGYEYMSQVRPSTGTADQKESLQITARVGCMEGRWPTEPASLEPDVRALMAASYALAKYLLDVMEPRSCPHLARGTLSGSHHLWSDDGQCTLRLLHYPPTQPPDCRDPMLWRAGPHTDWDCLTLLFQRPGNEGLECAANPRAGSSGGWVAVDPVPSGIAVNIGDMLSRWSSGRLLSNLHRVRMPTAAECSPPRSRFSMAFFMQADKSALIASGDEQEDITAGDYILGRIKSNYAK